MESTEPKTTSEVKDNVRERGPLNFWQVTKVREYNLRMADKECQLSLEESRYLGQIAALALEEINTLSELLAIARADLLKGERHGK